MAIVEEQTNRPIFDERALAKLLEAAYVVQEHNRERQATEKHTAESEALAAVETVTVREPEAPAAPVDIPEPPPTSKAPTAEVASPKAEARDDFARRMAQIIETQREMHLLRPEQENLMAFVAGRVCEIASAGGTAIGIVEGDKVRYHATAGLMAPADGTEVLKESALCAASLRTSQVLRSADIDTEFLIDPEECRRRGIQSMIVVPVFHKGAVAGGLELYYIRKQGFTEQDVHIAQLMAGLVTEALAREEEFTLKKSLASERAVMLEALEKLKPNLAALVDLSAKTSPTAAPASKATSVCGKCGHGLLAEEQFCGKCGSPRGGGPEAPVMQSKVASMWQMQGATHAGVTAPANGSAQHDLDAGMNGDQLDRILVESLEKEMPHLFRSSEAMLEETNSPARDDLRDFEEHLSKNGDHTLPAQLTQEVDENLSGEEREEESPAALSKPQSAPDWSSAASARQFLEQIFAKRPSGLVRFWQARRGDIYLAIAVVLVACVIRWGIWPNRPVGATGAPAVAAAQHHKSPDADLPWFDRVLIKLGLAEAPEPAAYMGNPGTQVWVDLHTALYYCPGADLYGKTPKGRFTTQREAQLDQFEPAYRKACD